MKNQRGSAIVMLFIAAALFGALAYAFLQGSRGSTGFMTDEQSKAYAQQIIAFSNDVKSAVKRIQLRGFDDTQIGSDNTVYKQYDGVSLSAPNLNCTSDTCQIFNGQGGGLIPQVLPGGTSTQINGTTAPSNNSMAGHARIRSIGFVGVGTAEPELVLQVYSLDRSVCGKINQILGIGNTDNYIPPLDTFNNNPYAGSFSTVTDYLGDTATLLAGKTGFCAISNDGLQYQFNVVLISR